MTRRRSRNKKPHNFSDKLILNQWILSLFGVSQLTFTNTSKPFHVLANQIKETPEGLGNDNLHHFFHDLIRSDVFRSNLCTLTEEQIQEYEENIVRHTTYINANRRETILWKYFQWLALMFIEIYLDFYFEKPDKLLEQLNVFVQQFNTKSIGFRKIPLYTEEDLNKLCMQNATGSGKTLILHVNVLQYKHYSSRHENFSSLTRIILLTPHERLSRQHLAEFQRSGISADNYLETRGGVFDSEQGLNHVDVLEITKLGDEDKDKTIATRVFGDRNLLLVDEGHRGMSSSQEGAWFSRRAQLCSKGFTIEYSATFEQAVLAAKDPDFEDSYAKSVIFDYSYRWFYEDGFGKDYHILNLPKSIENTRNIYLTACLLKFYQQLRLFDEKKVNFVQFNLEKPLWIFVGNTVSKVQQNNDTRLTATDVAIIVIFIAHFLENNERSIHWIHTVLKQSGQETGLLDGEDNDIFDGSFNFLIDVMDSGETETDIYQDILRRLFHCESRNGLLTLNRILGDSGEILLNVQGYEVPFGLISVGDTKGLCDHIQILANQSPTQLLISESDFREPVFSSINSDASTINLLVGSKKFVEGWDCWRVSTMGLMHVGRSEGAQIIQLFGRGVRLKGFQWSLKRSGRTPNVMTRPRYVEELETLNVFGIRADFMESFRNFLQEEGLPGNDRFKQMKIPLNVTYNFGKKLKVVRPKQNSKSGNDYDFNTDAPAISVGDIPEFLTRNKIEVDWYPRIKTIRSVGRDVATTKDEVQLSKDHLAMVQIESLYINLERYKSEKSWYNLNVSLRGIQTLLSRSDWYTLFIPARLLQFRMYEDILVIQQVVLELLKRYCEKLYNYRKRQFFEPRLEIQELLEHDENFPANNFYHLSVNESETQIIKDIKTLKKELQDNKDSLIEYRSFQACNIGFHLYQPLLHVRQDRKITVQPVSLNESEYQFVKDLQEWYTNSTSQEVEATELYLLRNLSKGRGIGFFEAGNFHPDFIMWLIHEQKQYVSFVEPHGMLRERPSSEKVKFYQTIKDIERRLNDPTIVLNSFILSWSTIDQLADWELTKEQFEKSHILFMKDDRTTYISKLFSLIESQVEVEDHQSV